MAARFEPVQESQYCSMDVNVGDLLIGSRCNWQVESLLSRGTCSLVFQVKAVGETKHSAYGLTAAAVVKVFREGNNYESAAWNEVQIQTDLRKDPEASLDCSVLQVLDHFYHNQHICLVYEKLSYDLHHILLRNSNKGLPLVIIQKLGAHLLRALQHLARKGIVHGDVKLANIMWNANRGIFQLVDFGLSFYEGKEVHSPQPLQSPGYECPEAHKWNKMVKEKGLSGMKSHTCTCASDMWSLACVLVRLYTGLSDRPMKQNDYPSTCIQCTQEQGQCGYNIDLDKNLTCPKDERCITEKQHQAFRDLITRMMKCKPDDRIPPEAALKHPFLVDPEIVSGLSLSEMLLLPTRFLQLANMYKDPSELADPEECQDFLSDVEQECTKHGKVIRVFIPEGDKPCEGKVCVEYESADSCETAVGALMGRTFSDRTVITSFYPHYLELKFS